MSDAKKTKEQLIKELQTLRRKLSKLESKPVPGKVKKNPAAKGVKPNQRTLRNAISADIEFIGDFDVIKARGVNISEGGICLKLSDNLPFEFQFYRDNTLHQYRAQLVWLKKLPTGEYHFGFKFIDDEPLPSF
jgi:hypothetical protein